jgi:signal transduction histidine kinase
LEKEPVELAVITSRAEEEVRPRVEASRQDLNISLPPEPSFLEADPTRLEQVFANLIDNASKSSGEGDHTELMVEVVSPKAEGGTAEEVIVLVRDEGIFPSWCFFNLLQRDASTCADNAWH